MTSRSDEDVSGQAPEPGRTPRNGSFRRRGLSSIGVRFAIGVVAVVALISGLTGMGLSQAARSMLVNGKLQSARMVVDSFLPSLAPALDFGDPDAILEHASRLRRSRDVTQVVVWAAGGERPVAALPPDGATPHPPREDRETMAAHEITVTRVVRSPVGTPTGALWVRFDLAPENAAYRQAEARIARWTGLLALAVALVVIGMARIWLLHPLRRLAEAMGRVRAGQHARVDRAGRDEIAQLAAGFNEMADAIRERETSLRSERERTQELLDHMREGIVVVGPDGGLLELRSRRAEQLFEGERLRGSLAGLLFGSAQGDVEREALEEWLAVAFATSPAEWDPVAALAPSDARVMDASGQEHHLELEFRPIVIDGVVGRIMVLFTDVTAQRQLERQVRAKEQEHQRQMRAMRALVAGGGQLLVSVLDGSYRRIAECRELVRDAPTSSGTVDGVFQRIHTIKGEARVFELDALTAAAAELECELGALRARSSDGARGVDVAERLLPGLDRVQDALTGARQMLVEASPVGEAILEQVTVLRGDLDELERCVDVENTALSSVVRRLTARPFGELVLNLPGAVERWAALLGKRAALEIVGREVRVERAAARALPGVLMHLVRNAVVHGIEPERERIEAGKPPVGRVSVECRQGATGLEITVRDDGRGIDEEKVMQCAATLGRHAGSASDAVFLPGISTADETLSRSGLAGRGMGLCAVEEELRALGFRVEMRNEARIGVDVHIRVS
jgi:two-component system, chemotaxis family, sensor kinase CheA